MKAKKMGAPRTFTLNKQMRCNMDFFKSSVERLLCNKNPEGLSRELTATREQAEGIYSAYVCSFPVTEINKFALGRNEHCNASQTLGEHK